jgi:hypothetical protein
MEAIPEDGENLYQEPVFYEFMGESEQVSPDLRPYLDGSDTRCKFVLYYKEQYMDVRI